MGTKKKPKAPGRSLSRAERKANGQRQLAIWLPADMLDAVDRLAEREGVSRTELVGASLMAALVRKGALP